MKRRKEVLQIRLSEEEKEMLEALAENYGMSMASAVRMLVRVASADFPAPKA